MKRFEDLSKEQQKEAVNRALHDIVNGLMNGTVDIKLNHEMHNRVLHMLLDRCKRTNNWSRFEYFVRKTSHFKREVDAMAHKAAERAFYTEPSEYVIYGIAGEELDDVG